MFIGYMHKDSDFPEGWYLYDDGNIAGPFSTEGEAERVSREGDCPRCNKKNLRGNPSMDYYCNNICPVKSPDDSLQIF